MSKRVQFLEHRARPVAIHEKPVRCRLRRRHDGQPVDVGGHRLGTAARIDALDEIAARFDRLPRKGRRRTADTPRSPDRRTPRAICGPSNPQRTMPSPVCTRRSAAETREHGAGAACYHAA